MKIFERIDSIRRGLEKVCDCVGCTEMTNCINIFCTINRARRELDGLENEVKQMEHLDSAEKQACFRLGQMDMQASAVDALQDAAVPTVVGDHTVLFDGVSLLNSLEVDGHA